MNAEIVATYPLSGTKQTEDDDNLRVGLRAVHDIHGRNISGTMELDDGKDLTRSMRLSYTYKGAVFTDQIAVTLQGHDRDLLNPPVEEALAWDPASRQPVETTLGEIDPNTYEALIAVREGFRSRYPADDYPYNPVVYPDYERDLALFKSVFITIREGIFSSNRTMGSRSGLLAMTELENDQSFRFLYGKTDDLLDRIVGIDILRPPKGFVAFARHLAKLQDSDVNLHEMGAIRVVNQYVEGALTKIGYPELISRYPYRNYLALRYLVSISRDLNSVGPKDVLAPSEVCAVIEEQIATNDRLASDMKLQVGSLPERPLLHGQEYRQAVEQIAARSKLVHEPLTNGGEDVPSDGESPYYASLIKDSAIRSLIQVLSGGHPIHIFGSLAKSMATAGMQVDATGGLDTEAYGLAGSDADIFVLFPRARLYECFVNLRNSFDNLNNSGISMIRFSRSNPTRLTIVRDDGFNYNIYPEGELTNLSDDTNFLFGYIADSEGGGFLMQEDGGPEGSSRKNLSELSLADAYRALQDSSDAVQRVSLNTAEIRSAYLMFTQVGRSARDFCLGIILGTSLGNGSDYFRDELIDLSRRYNELPAEAALSKERDEISADNYRQLALGISMLPHLRSLDLSRLTSRDASLELLGGLPVYRLLFGNDYADRLSIDNLDAKKQANRIRNATRLLDRLGNLDGHPPSATISMSEIIGSSIALLYVDGLSEEDSDRLISDVTTRTTSLPSGIIRAVPYDRSIFVDMQIDANQIKEAMVSGAQLLTSNEKVPETITPLTL